MTRNVTEQELDALLSRPDAQRHQTDAQRHQPDAQRHPPDTQPQVEARDFREPHWLTPEELGALRARGRTAGTAVAEALRAAMTGEVELEHVEVAEDSLESVRRLQDDHVVLVCENAAGPSLAMMHRPAALFLVEQALGGGESDPPDPVEAARTSAARPLSPFESELVERLLGSAFLRVSQAFGSTAKDPRAVSDSAELGRILPPGSDRGDHRRIAVRIGIAVGTRTLVLQFLLPPIAPEPRKAAGNASPRRAAPVSLPAEIASTRVEVSAVLGELEIMLTDLLALEAGDLIPLSVTPGEPIDVHIEGELCGRARFGARAGRLAVRMTEVFRTPPTR